MRRATIMCYLSIICLILISSIVSTIIIVSLGRVSQALQLFSKVDRTSKREKIEEVVSEVVDDAVQDLLKEVRKIKLSTSSINIGQPQNSKNYAAEKRDNKASSSKAYTKNRKKETPNKNNLNVDAWRVNYADMFCGSQIVDVIATPVCSDDWLSDLFSSKYGENPPENILRPEMEPGSCFAFRYNEAVVTVALAQPIRIDAIEISHIPKYKSPAKDTSSAPREFSAYAIDQWNVEEFLGLFEYENRVCNQVFPVYVLQQQSSFVRFEFHSNHGNPVYTCVYKVGVYGQPAV